MFDLVEMFGFCCGALLDLRGRLVGLFPQDTITGGATIKTGGER
jgi:hypothetical protein